MGLLLWLQSMACAANMPPHLTDFITKSPNGKYDFVMLGVENIPPTGFLHGGIKRDNALRDRYPLTGLYLHDSNIPLWTAEINAFDVIVADDGHHLARIGPWPLLDDYEELAVDFYEDGNKIRSYTVRDLIGNKEWCLPKSWSHYRWLMDIDEPHSRAGKSVETMTLKTHLGQLIEFNLSNGEMHETTPPHSRIICNPFSPQERIRFRQAQEEADKSVKPKSIISPPDEEHQSNPLALLVIILGVVVVIFHSWQANRPKRPNSQSFDHEEP